MKFLRMLFGAIFIVMGLAMLVMVLRQGGAEIGRTMIGPLALMGAGALAVANTRKRR